jgi:hypothetical protein
VLLQPGHFRPPTLICAELQADALAQFRRDEAVGEAPVVSLLGLTLEDLSVAGEVHLRDYLDRIDALAAGEFTVLISSYRYYFRLVEYLSRYTSEPIRIALGVPNLGRIFDEQKQLEGGVLESLGRLFKHQVKLLVYPKLDTETGELVTAENFRMNSVLDVLYRYLRDSGRIDAIETFNRQHLYIRAEDVRQKLSEGDPTWEDMVPTRVAQAIKEKELFGYHAPT